MPNRLASSTSPYLLQHAHNPVDWWPWCPEAFAQARLRDVPVFLSVGYSACYWCHVMERECFESAEIAAAMNEHLVCVKVDREERPDVDAAYMAAVQMLTGHGGWPMSVFLSPLTLEPFWGGTYFPPVPAHGRPGFAQVCRAMAGAWRTRRDEVTAQAADVGRAVRERLGAARPAPGAGLGIAHVQAAVTALLTTLDRAEGGFGGGGAGGAGGAPKFPQAVYPALLMAARGRTSDEAGREAIDAALRLTLDKMALGGMHDQVGGGFHRYSVDSTWTVPHFEKMLYDNAQLLELYAHAAAAMTDAFYARVVRRIVGYLDREMTARAGPGAGLFFTAQDAEVDGREGLNYLWTPAEVDAALADQPAEAPWARATLGLDGGPNFQDPHHPLERPSNVLRLDRRPDDPERLDRVCDALLAARARRKQPRLDDKLLLGWNGQMIAALARAGQWLNDASLIARASRAAEAALAVFGPARGAGSGARWSRVASASGAAHGTALLEDLAFLAGGLAALARADGPGRQRWTAAAEHAVAEATRLMGDGTGGFFDAPAIDPTSPDALFVRSRSAYDGAQPCGQSVMLHALIDLAELAGTESAPGKRHLDAALALLGSLAGEIEESSVACAHSTAALLRLLVIAGPRVAAVTANSRADTPTPAPGPTDSRSVVRIMADLPPPAPGQPPGLELAFDTPAELWLRLEIEPGYHINDAHAAAASGGRLIGLRVDAATPGAGLEVYCDYPPGTPLDPTPPGTGGPAVLSGTVDLRVVLARVQPEAGHARTEQPPSIVVAFQACSADACLAPARVRLDLPLRWAES